jgi:hypothetical protein
MSNTTLAPSRFAVWLNAARPRTLPLALACIITGTGLAAADGAFNWLVALLCVLTAVLLQILSNLANDYGDSLHGADHGARQGPKRAVQAGLVTPAAMRQGHCRDGAADRGVRSAAAVVRLRSRGVLVAAVVHCSRWRGHRCGHHLHRGQVALWLRRAGRPVGAAVLRLARRARQLLRSGGPLCPGAAAAGDSLRSAGRGRAQRQQRSRSGVRPVGRQALHSGAAGSASRPRLSLVAPRSGGGLRHGLRPADLHVALATPLPARRAAAGAQWPGRARTEALHTLNPWLRQMSLAALAFATLFALGQALPTIFV